MKRLFWIMTSFWAIATVSIATVTQLPIGHPCTTAISMRSGEMGSYNEQVLDLRTGIISAHDYVKPWQVSPSGDQRLMPHHSSEFSQDELYLVSTQGNQQELLYRSPNQLSATWAADGNSMFVYEESAAQDINPVNRLYRFDVNTGRIIREYGTSLEVVSTSPDLRYLHVEYLDPNSDQVNMASINTLTGDMTSFERAYPDGVQRWSLDNQWWVRGGRDEFYVIDPATGNLHPQLNHAIEGHSPVWTSDSLWFLRETDEQYTIWKASLKDGNIELAYEDALLFSLSPDDRWAVIAEESGSDLQVILHDRLNDTRYSDLDIYHTDFSDDGRCLIVTSRGSIEAEDGAITVYDLDTMQSVYTSDANPYTMRYAWYD